MKRLGLVLGLAMTTVMGFSTVDASSITGIRVFNGVGQSRIVLDMKDRPESWDLTTQGNDIILSLPHTVNQNSNPVQYEGSHGVMKGIRLQPKGEAMQVIISMNEPVQHHVFALNEPDRMVLDAFTKEEEKIHTTVSPTMELTRWTKATEDGRQRYTILSIKASQPITAVTSEKPWLQVTKNSTKAVAVGGNTPQEEGIYEKGVWKNGLVHDTGALAYIPGYGYDIGWLEAKIEAAFPDGSRVVIDGINRKRKANELILYTREYGSKTGTNIYGAEAVIANNKVVKKGKNNLPLEAGQYVLSAHGTKASTIEKLAVGATVSRHWHLPEHWKKAQFIYGGGLLVLKNGVIDSTVQSSGHHKNAPWTLLGVTKNHNLLVLGIDGWQGSSVGVSLEEGVKEIQRLGAVQAIALRADGKVAIAHDGVLVNHPANGEPGFSSLLVWKE